MLFPHPPSRLASLPMPPPSPRKLNIYSHSKFRSSMLLDTVFRRFSLFLFNFCGLWDGGTRCSIGSVLSPHNGSLMKAVKLRKKEGSSLLLLRYSIL